MKTAKQTDLNALLGKSQVSESMGSIQDVCGFDTQIQIQDGEVREGKYGKYALLTVISKNGKQKVHSSSMPIIETVEKLIKANCFNGTDLISCMVKKGKSSNDRTFYSLVGMEE